MRTSRTGYLMAMLAGLTIVGASTGGVVAATAHHDQNTAAAANAAAATPDTLIPLNTSSATSETGKSEVTTDPVTATPLPTTSAETPGSVVSSRSRSPAAITAPATPTMAPATPSTPKTAASASIAKAPVTLGFKDGQYTATGSYNSPGGIEKLGVTLTLRSDKVTKSALDLQGGAGLSHSFQSAFETGYSSQVIGKDIGSISLGAVSGSSLTGLGFDDALKQIKTKARLQQ